MSLPVAPEVNSEEVWGRGTCTRCGAQDVDLHAICDDEYVCASCLESDYDKCEGCGQYWSSDVMERRGDKFVCPDCACNYEDDEDGDEG